MPVCHSTRLDVPLQPPSVFHAVPVARARERRGWGRDMGGSFTDKLSRTKPSCPLHPLPWACPAGTTLASLPRVNLPPPALPHLLPFSFPTPFTPTPRRKCLIRDPPGRQILFPEGGRARSFSQGLASLRGSGDPKHFVGLRESPWHLPSLLLSILSPRAAGRAWQGGTTPSTRGWNDARQLDGTFGD